MPWQDRTTVVLDVRRRHSEESIERAVSAAASVVTSLPLSSTTSCGLERRCRRRPSEQPRARRGDHRVLATVDASGHGSLRGLLDRLRRSRAGGSLVARAREGHQEQLEALASLRRSFGRAVVVVRITDGAERRRPETCPSPWSMPAMTGPSPPGGRASWARLRRSGHEQVGEGAGQGVGGHRGGLLRRSPPPRPSASAGSSSGGRSSGAACWPRSARTCWPPRAGAVGTWSSPWSRRPPGWPWS